MYSHEKAQRQLLPLTAEQEANPKVKRRRKGVVLGVDIVACRLEGRWTYFVIHHLPKTKNTWMGVCLLIIIIRNHHYVYVTKPKTGVWRAGELPPARAARPRCVAGRHCTRTQDFVV